MGQVDAKGLWGWIRSNPVAAVTLAGLLLYGSLRLAIGGLIVGVVGERSRTPTPLMWLALAFMVFFLVLQIGVASAGKPSFLVPPALRVDYRRRRTPE